MFILYRMTHLAAHPFAVRAAKLALTLALGIMIADRAALDGVVYGD